MNEEVNKKDWSRVPGLKKLRKGTSSGEPIHHCKNCNCIRYNECTCTKKAGK